MAELRKNPGTTADLLKFWSAARQRERFTFRESLARYYADHVLLRRGYRISRKDRSTFSVYHPTAFRPASYLDFGSPKCANGDFVTEREFHFAELQRDLGSRRLRIILQAPQRTDPRRMFLDISLDSIAIAQIRFNLPRPKASGLRRFDFRIKLPENAQFSQRLKIESRPTPISGVQKSLVAPIPFQIVQLKLVR
jgi:hypothetical protein